MRLARKLFLLAAMAVTALALTAGSASAQVENDKRAFTEPGNVACGTVTLVVHNATGGCHITFASSHAGIPLHAYIPAKTTLSNCEVHLEGQIDSNAEGWIDSIDLEAPESGAVPCTRTPCDELNGVDLPWRFHVVEHSSTDEEVEAVFCLRPSTSAPGSLGTQCEIHLEFTDLGSHDYEVGHETGPDREAFCENNPPNPTGHPTPQFPVSIEGHLTSVGTQESGTVEIRHAI